MLVFRSEAHVTNWLSGRQGGATIPITKLAELAMRLRDEGVAIEPLQLAALLLEASVDDHLLKPRKTA